MTAAHAARARSQAAAETSLTTIRRSASIIAGL
jgi:hypothetical protein